MADNADRSTVPAAIFIDMENMGVAGRTGHFYRLMDWLLDGLKKNLPKYGMHRGPVWAVAFQQDSKHHVIPARKRDLDDLFRRNNGMISWSTTDADSQLISTVERQLADDSLAKVMVLVSGDNDFAKLVADVRKTGRHVIVLIPHATLSSELEQAADVALSLIEFFGTNPPENPRTW